MGSPSNQPMFQIKETPSNVVVRLLNNAFGPRKPEGEGGDASSSSSSTTTTTAAGGDRPIKRRGPLNSLFFNERSSANSVSTATTEVTSCCSDSSSVSIYTTRIRKTVRFSNTATQCLIILSRHDYSIEEVEACWFQSKEYGAITKECCKQIKKMEQGESLRDKKYCTRGLENHTRVKGMAKNENRRAGYDAVLEEQEEQISLGVVDDGAIAQRYINVSSSCQLWATALGLQDQREMEAQIED